MTAAVLAAASAVVFGTADFFGGFATKRSPVFAVVVLSQLFGVALLLPLLPLLPGTAGAPALVWGALAGAGGGAGLIIFYRALATGVMSIVAPTTAVVAAGLPVLAGLAMGDRPPGVALIGIGVAIVAVLLISREPSSGAIRLTIWPLLLALAAGAGFGTFFVFLSMAPADAGLWPLLGARISSLSLIMLVAVGARRPLRPAAGSLATIAWAGVLDMAANILYLLAVQDGMLSLVAVLSSLYPASTLLLARWVLGERLRAIQITGVGCALAAVALIALP